MPLQIHSSGEQSPASGRCPQQRRRDTPDSGSFYVCWPSAAQHRANPLGGTPHRRIPGRAGLVFGERAVRRAEPQREGQRLATIGKPGAAVVVDQPRVFK